MIRIAIADPQRVVRDGLAQLLATATDLHLVGTAGDGPGALALVDEHAPDVMLLNLSMPGLDGVEVTRRIVAGGSATRVVVLTSIIEREQILAVLDAGATGYLLMDAEPDELFRGIRAAASGEPTTAARPADGADGSPRSDVSDPAPIEGLTPREREVLLLVAAGLINKEVALRLGIAEATVKTHLTRVFRRIGVSDRTQAALWVERRGLAG